VEDTPVETDTQGDEDVTQMDPTQSAARYYFTLTLSLANQDITKIEQINQLPVYLVLNTASLIKDQRIQEQNELKKLKEQTKR